MSDRIPEIETSVNLLRSIIWQYDNAESVKSLISQKNEWYKKEQTEFWDNWFRDVFDIRTANDFGLEIWSIILGVSFLVPDCPGKVLTTEQKRLICRLRYYQLITRCTIPEVNEITMKLFATEDRKAYALDPLDMSYIMYVFTEQPTSAVALILAKYDLLPRPATVGLKYRVIRYVPFGFGQYYQNFDNAPFWDGGGLINYAWRINLSFDNSKGAVKGGIASSDSSIDLSGIDVTLFYTNSETGQSFTREVVTQAGGIFTDSVADSGTYTVIAKAQIFTPICTTDNVESRPFTFTYVIPGMKVKIRVVNQSYALFTLPPENIVDFTIDFGDGVDSRDYQVSAQGYVTSKRPLTVGGEYILNVKGEGIFSFDAGIKPNLLPFNALLEVISVSGNRSDMRYFSRNHKTLTKIHDKALFDLPNVKLLDGVFFGCSGLTVIPPDIFINCKNATSFSSAFYECTGLMSIPAGLFDNTPKVVTFASTFQACSNITTIPEGLFNNTTLVSSMVQTFFGCTSVIAIPSGLLDSMPQLTSLHYTFAYMRKITTLPDGLLNKMTKLLSLPATFNNCSALHSLPAGFFDALTGIQALEGTFQHCSRLAQIPAGLLDNNAQLTSVNSLFNGCSALTTIPDKLLDNNINLTNVGGLFNGCSSLTAIPTGLFDKTTLVNNVIQLFFSCAKLQSIPAGLFDHMPLITSLGYVFGRCNNLTAIPAGLFDKTNRVISITSLFNDCFALTFIPTGLFDAMPLVSDASNVFGGCLALQSIPAGVFAKLPLVTTFSGVFYSCNTLKTIPSGLFDNNTQATNFTRAFTYCGSIAHAPAGLLNKTKAATLGVIGLTTPERDYRSLFSGCTALEVSLDDLFDAVSYPLMKEVQGLFFECSKLTGSGLAFIAKVPQITDVSKYQGAFYRCTSLSDYDQLPALWRTR